MEILALGLVSISLFYIVILLVAARFLPRVEDDEIKRPKTFYQKFAKRFSTTTQDDQEAAA